MTLFIKHLMISSEKNTLVDLSLNIDKSIALVGGSGSGKSLTIKAILGLLASNLELNFEYETDFTLEKKYIGFIPQNPFTAFSPLTKIQNQFFIPKQKQVELLQMVNLSHNVLDKFPSELSGGQLQRLLIAFAISKNPKLILFDEPTTALDNENKQIIINLIQKIKTKTKALILYVTHDISSIENICDNIAVLKKGEIVETGLTSDVLQNPKNKYTNELIASNFKNRSFRK